MLLHEKLRTKNLILASRSPRRSQLLHDCGLLFTIAQPYEAEEIWPSGMDSEAVPEYLARLKSDAYPHALGADDILLTADTGVILDGEILGKPADRDAAIAMLRRLSGARHRVSTGVAIRDASRVESFTAHTDVWFRELSDEEIEFYVDNYRPYDKAGAYGIQEWIGYAAVRRIEGSYFNVMGLPMQRLYVTLDRFFDTL